LQNVVNRFSSKIKDNLGAFGVPAYRRYWFGSFASVGAIQISTIVQGWLIIDEMGGTPLWLGYLGASTSIPTIIVAIFGGVLADKFNKRTLMFIISSFMAISLVILALLDSSGHIKLWHVLLIAAIQGVFAGLDGPIRSSFFPLLISRKHMMSAVALSSAMWQLGRILAPAIGGWIIVSAGTEGAFFAASIGWILMILLLITIKVEMEESKSSFGLMGQIGEGFKYIKKNNEILIIIIMTYATHFFGFQSLQLMPLFAKRLGQDAVGLGLMFSVMGIGSLIGTLVVQKIKKSDYVGYIMLSGSMLFCLSLILFAFTDQFFVALLLLFIGPFFNTLYFVTSMTIVQLRVLNQMRGRVMGIYTITFSLIPLGGMMGGFVAEIFDERFAITIGAVILCLITILIMIYKPNIRNIKMTDIGDR
jgi:MFS family permease